MIDKTDGTELARAFNYLWNKYIEQEPMLNKIRAEIEEYKSRQLTLAIDIEDLEKGKQIAIEYILAIINKYKTESNSKE